MKLPIDEENDEQMVGVPEAFKLGSTPLLDRKPDHNTETEPHDPSGDTGARCKVGQQKDNESFLGGTRRGNGEVCKIDHVGEGVNDRPEDEGPSVAL